MSIAFANFMRATKAPPRDPTSRTPRPWPARRCSSRPAARPATSRRFITRRRARSSTAARWRCSPALGNKIIHPFSDFLLHDIGTGDGIPIQPTAEFASTANQIRTAPLWALRTRNRLMHDGLSFTRQEAILRHAGQATAAKTGL